MFFFYLEGWALGKQCSKKNHEVIPHKIVGDIRFIKLQSEVLFLPIVRRIGHGRALLMEASGNYLPAEILPSPGARPRHV